MSASAIYEGTVRHRRYAERTHEFTYPLALTYLDLDELPALPLGRARLVRFERSDYLGDPRRPLSTEVRDLVDARTGNRPGGPVRVLTQLRSFGHCFNPVSFYYCFDANREHVEAVVAEVTNTPWGERHAYVVERAGPGILTGDSEKVLHVSPFMDMDQRYEWRVADPAQTLSVHIENRKNGKLLFDATLSLRRRQLSRNALAAMTLRYPAATARVLTLIYAHALRLKLKGVRVRPHPQEAPA